MNDVVYRQDVLDISMKYCSDDDGSCSEPHTDLREMLDEIENLPSAQQWIPCEKKMPKAEEKVWIQTQSGKACFAMYEDGTISENDSNWAWFDIEYSSWNEDEDCGIIPEGWWEFTQFHPDCEFDCPVDEKVVAWMPLPEPYKGESNG